MEKAELRDRVLVIPGREVDPWGVTAGAGDGRKGGGGAMMDPQFGANRLGGEWYVREGWGWPLRDGHVKYDDVAWFWSQMAQAALAAEIHELLVDDRRAEPDVSWFWAMVAQAALTHLVCEPLPHADRAILVRETMR